MEDGGRSWRSAPIGSCSFHVENRSACCNCSFDRWPRRETWGEGGGGRAASITTIEEIHDRQKAGNPPILSLIHDLSRPFKLYLTARSVNKLSLAITRVSLLSYFRFGKCAEFSGYYVRIPWIARLSSPLNSRDRRLARNSDTSFK